MSEQEANPNPPAPGPVNRGRGRRFAIYLLIGVVVCVVAYPIYRGIAAKVSERTCQSHLKQIGAALLAYHERFGSLPPAFVNGKNGKPAHSWRVLLLPFLDRQDLYDAYRLDEPWDSANNLRLAAQMPEVFACPAGPRRETGKTCYVAVVDSKTVWPGELAAKLPYLARSPTETILLIEIADSEIRWTEPRDVLMDEIIVTRGTELTDLMKARHNLKSGHTGIVNMLLCDGDVKAVRTTFAPFLFYKALCAWGGAPYQSERQIIQAADFPAEQDAGALPNTDVLPHLAGPLKPGRNYISCATFQLAWDDFRKVVGGAPQIEGQPAIAAGMNGAAFPRSSLLPDYSYVAEMGRVRDGIRDKIIAEMEKKFPGVTPPISDDLEQNDLIAYAFLQKNLPFFVKFDDLTAPLVFHAAEGDARVASFGFEKLESASSNKEGLKEQVDVLHYESDQKFILRLKTQTDEIVLAKIRPGATLAETLRTVQSLIEAGAEKEKPPKLDDADVLIIPRLRFNLLRRYDELIGRRLENPGKEAWRIEEAEQGVRFLLNESGAKLESFAELGVTFNGHTPPPPRRFIFDQPFLLYLKERTGAQPYLVMWVANAELMEPRE